MISERKYAVITRIRKARALACIASSVLVLAMSGSAGATGPAQGSDARVWVVQDVTAQAGCLQNGAPCRVGAVSVFHVYKVDQQDAIAQHRAYAPANVNRTDLSRWLRSQEAAMRPAPSQTARPNIMCTAHMPQTDPFSVTLPDIHSTISASMKYDVYSTCYRKAISLAQSVTSGPSTYQDGNMYAQTTGGTIYDNDGAGASCIALAHTGNFSGALINTVDPMETWVQYSSGSACTYFGDTFDDVNYWWSE